MSLSRDLCRTVLFLFTLSLAACSLPPSPQQGSAAVEQQKVNIQTLQAQFRADVEAAGDRRSLSGVLLFQAPDALRLRLMMLFGFTVYDGVALAERAWESSPFFEVSKSEPLLPRIGKLSFLNSFRGCEAVPVAVDHLTMHLNCSDENYRRVLEIDRQSGLPRAESVIDDRGLAVAAQYSDYREVSGHLLPFRIFVKQPSRALNIELSVSSYDLNSPLPRRSFEHPSMKHWSRPLR